MNNLPILSCEEVREIDLHTIENVGIPQAALMEEASERVFAAMCRDFPEILTSKILVLAGNGNNGADSLCIARKLFFAGAEVSIYILNDKGSDLFVQHLKVCRNLGIEIKVLTEEPDCSIFDFAIDGLFGVGYKYNSQRPFPLSKKWLSYLKDMTLLSVDIPSGLTTEAECVIQADVTYSIGYPKTIFYNAQTRFSCGKIRHIEISFDKIKNAVSCNLVRCVKEKSVIINNFVHKYKRGSCLIIGGSPGKNGAVAYCISTAFAAGCGIVAVLTGELNFPDVTNVKKEAVYDVIENLSLYEHYSCVVIGPGLSSLNEQEKKRIIDFIEKYPGQFIFDASFFTVFSKDVLKKCAKVPLLTPHSGEFRKFFDVKEISIEQTCDIARQYNCNILLKDSFMILAMFDGTSKVFDFPMRIAAQAGSGDLLAGYIAGNILQIDDFCEAVSFSVIRFYNELKKFADRKFYPPEEFALKLSYSDA